MYNKCGVNNEPPTPNQDIKTVGTMVYKSFSNIPCVDFEPEFTQVGDCINLGGILFFDKKTRKEWNLNNPGNL